MADRIVVAVQNISCGCKSTKRFDGTISIITCKNHVLPFPGACMMDIRPCPYYAQPAHFDETWNDSILFTRKHFYCRGSNSMVLLENPPHTKPGTVRNGCGVGSLAS